VLSISHTGSYSELDKSSPHPKTLFVWPFEAEARLNNI
jgi:hypothetical protein